MEELEAEIKRLKEQHQAELTRLDQEHEDKVLFLLRQMPTTQVECSGISLFFEWISLQMFTCLVYYNNV